MPLALEHIGVMQIREQFRLGALQQCGEWAPPAPQIVFPLVIYWKSYLGGEKQGAVANANPHTLLFSLGLQLEFINPIFEFSKGMNDLQLNDAEYALLIAINIFSAGKKPGRGQSSSTESKGRKDRADVESEAKE